MFNINDNAYTINSEIIVLKQIEAIRLIIPRESPQRIKKAELRKYSAKFIVICKVFCEKYDTGAYKPTYICVINRLSMIDEETFSSYQ